jgi:hypothetical protein
MMGRLLLRCICCLYIYQGIVGWMAGCTVLYLTPQSKGQICGLDPQTPVPGHLTRSIVLMKIMHTLKTAGLSEQCICQVSSFIRV